MSKKLKITLIALAILLLVIISIAVYRLFFQFSNKEVNAFINKEGEKYGSVQAVAIISSGVHHILNSHSLTKEVLDYSKATGIQKEQVLVSAAVAQAKAYGYLE